MFLYTTKHKTDLLSDVLQKVINEQDLDFVAGHLSSDSLELDVVVNCLHFVYKEGLCYEKTKAFLKFFHRFFRDTVCLDLPLEDAVEQLRVWMNELAASGMYNASFLVSSVDYMMTTVLQHYHLMVFAMCHTRQYNVHQNAQTIHVPMYEPINLQHGKQIDLWRMEESLKKQSEIVEHEEMVLSNKLQSTIEAIQDELQKFFASLEDTNIGTLNFEEMTDIVRNIIIKQTEMTAVEVEVAIEKSQNLLQYNIEKITIKNQFKELKKTAGKSYSIADKLGLTPSILKR